MHAGGLQHGLLPLLFHTLVMPEQTERLKGVNPLLPNLLQIYLLKLVVTVSLYVIFILRKRWGTSIFLWIIYMDSL